MVHEPRYDGKRRHNNRIVVFVVSCRPDDHKRMQYCTRTSSWVPLQDPVQHNIWTTTFGRHHHLHRTNNFMLITMKSFLMCPVYVRQRFIIFIAFLILSYRRYRTTGDVVQSESRKPMQPYIFFLFVFEVIE